MLFSATVGSYLLRTFFSEVSYFDADFFSTKAIFSLSYLHYQVDLGPIAKNK